MPDRTYLVLQVVAGLAVVVLSLALAPWLAHGELPGFQAIGSVAAVLLGLASIELFRRRSRVLGVVAMVGAVWAHVAWPMVTLGLSHSLMGTRFAVLPLALVALLLGRRALWITVAAFSAAAAAGAARDLGWFGGGGPLPTLLPTSPLLSTLTLFLLVALLLHLLSGALRSALAEALRGHQALLERERMQEQLRQGQKLEAVGRLAGGVAHDFNNILTSVLATASLAREALPPDHPVCADLDQIRQDAERAAGLTRQLLTFARKEVAVPALVEVDARVAALSKMLQRVLGEHVALETHLGAPGAMVRIDPSQLEQVILNLAVNARDAMPDGGCLELRTSVARRGGSEEWVTLAVTDEGMGIPAEVLPHIFEPFFTTKAPDRGSGLGLATCHGIVTQAGGELDVESQPGQGSRFWVALPRAFGEAPAAEERRGPEAGGQETVLVVDDQASVLGVASRALRARGYLVLESSSVARAIELASRHAGEIDLALVDVGLPDGSGRDVADALLATRPGVQILFTSGYPADEVVRRRVADASVEYLQKPYSAEDLAQAVRRVLDLRRRAAPGVVP